MLRRFLIVLFIIGCFPAWASAYWYVSASTSPTTGGTISSPGTVMYPDTTLSVDYTVTPNPGYAISAVRNNGTALTAVSPGVYRVSKATSTQYLVAYFVAKTYSVTMSVTSGGAISPAFSSPPPSALTAGGNYTFNIIPNSGYMITDVKVDGASVGAVSSYTFYNINANHTLSATFAIQPKVVARAVPLESHTKGLGPAYGVQVDGSGSTTTVGSLAYLWWVSNTSPAGLTGGGFTDPAIAMPIFYADRPGTYTVTLTASDGLGHSDQTNISVEAMTRQAYLSLYCASCHDGRNPDVMKNYKISPHYNTLVAVPSCQYCHAPGQAEDTGHYTIQFPYDSCKSCHTSFSPNTPGHLAEVGASDCYKCHDSHSTLPTGFYGTPPHFTNVTTGVYPASWNTSRIVCANCHSPNADSMQAEQNRNSWAGSGHSGVNDPAWMGQDFKTLNGCVRCHTTTGFVAYSTTRVTSAWGSSSDKTKEVLACSGCHNQDFSLRSMKPYSSATAFSFRIDALNEVSVPYKNTDYSSSNLCLRCHGGTTSGEIIKRAFAFSGFTAAGRLLNHFMVGGGVLENNVGYEYDGTPRGNAIDYNKQNTWHSGIGSTASAVETGSGGACVVCHMSAPGNGHGFKAATVDQYGAVQEIQAQAVCDKCHPSQLGGGPKMTPQGMNSYKNGFTSALAVLKAQLQAKGMNPDAPAGINWGSDQSTRANNMGAFYNYFLLSKSDKAGYVHNATYVKRLILYSLDWLDNAQLDDSVGTTIHAIAVPQATKDAAASYLGVDDTAAGTDCVNCHQAYYN